MASLLLSEEPWGSSRRGCWAPEPCAVLLSAEACSGGAQVCCLAAGASLLRGAACGRSSRGLWLGRGARLKAASSRSMAARLCNVVRREAAAEDSEDGAAGCTSLSASSEAPREEATEEAADGEARPLALAESMPCGCDMAHRVSE